MGEFTSRQRAEIHSALDALIVRRQWTDPPSPLVKDSSWAWPAPKDYERLDARPAP